MPYELVRILALVLDEGVLPASFDDWRPRPRLACEQFPAGCDRAAAGPLTDTDTAAATRIGCAGRSLRVTVLEAADHVIVPTETAPLSFDPTARTIRNILEPQQFHTLG